MDDTISRQAAIDALMVAINDVGILDGDDIRAVFDNLPSAQPTQEIIRCKDCKQQNTNNDFRSMWCREMLTFVKSDEFCSRAEKR